MKEPAFVGRMAKGPLVFMTVIAGGHSFMGTSLALWFVYCIVVSVFGGYVGGRALAPGADYLDVFRFVGTVAFACYAMSLPQASIWYKRDWVTTIRSMFDGLVYGSLTAGMFGWLWPKSPSRPIGVGERGGFLFRRLHAAGCFVMPNPWDLGSAHVPAQLGFPALATTSAGFAWSMGRARQRRDIGRGLGAHACRRRECRHPRQR